MSKVEAELEKQTVKLYEKLKVYSGGAVGQKNLLSSTMFGMKELKQKKLSGENKKSILTQVLLTIIQEGSELVGPEDIENMIEDLYIGARTLFKRTGCCG